MKTNILIAIVIGLATYGLTIYFNHNNEPNISIPSAPESHALPKIELGMQAPDFSFQDLGGADYKLSTFEDKIVILNFWASWCAPCIKEFPALLAAAESYSEDVVLIALSSDHDKNAMLRFLDKMKKDGLPLERENVLIALDEDNRITREVFQTFRLPETIIIGRGGIMHDKLIGADWGLEDLDALIMKLK